MEDEPNNRKRPADIGITQADIFLIVGCLIVSVLTGILFFINRQDGDMISISCDGALLDEIALEQTHSRYYLIRYMPQETLIEQYDHYPQLPDSGGYNLLSITAGQVRMEAADCRDQICVHHQPIGSDRENIICLPHKLVIEVSAGMSAGSYDGEWERRTDEPLDESLDGMVR